MEYKRLDSRLRGNDTAVGQVGDDLQVSCLSLGMHPIIIGTDLIDSGKQVGTMRFHTKKIGLCLGATIALAVFGGGCSGPKTELFNPETYKGPVGNVVLSSKGETMLSLLKIENGKPGGIIMVNTKSAELKLPIGKYDLLNYTSKVQGRDGKTWALSGGPADPAKPIAFDVTLAKTVNLKIGAPLTASIKVTQKGNKTVNMDLLMLDIGGNKCQITQDGGSSAPPGFVVLSKSRMALMSGNFAYG